MYPTAQIVPISKTVQKVPGRKSNAINEVVFRALNIPPLGILAYAIAKKTQDNVVEQSQPAKFISNEVNKFVRYINYSKLKYNGNH